MQPFELEVQLRWSDLDPNFHLRHSVYYDWGALSRISFLQGHGLTPALMQELQFGPIIFREEAIFRKEVRMGDQIKIDLKLIKAKKDYSRWTIQHHIIKSGSILCCVLTIDGAWINTKERKLFSPPAQVSSVFDEMEKSPDFTWDS